MKNSLKKDVKILTNFLEEFSWIVEKYKDVDLNQLNKELWNSLDSRRTNNLSLFYSENNSNKNYLIGVLPKLLQDKELFEKNMDLVSFSNALGIEVKFGEKRSRYEIIGAMLCQISELNDEKLDKVVVAIEAINNDQSLLTNLKNLKKNAINYDWNLIIQELNSGSI